MRNRSGRGKRLSRGVRRLERDAALRRLSDTETFTLRAEVQGDKFEGFGGETGWILMLYF